MQPFPIDTVWEAKKTPPYQQERKKVRNLKGKNKKNKDPEEIEKPKQGKFPNGVSFFNDYPNSRTYI